MKNHINNRRNFIKKIGLTSLGLASLPASIFQLETWAACTANNSSIDSTDDYKALVCFYMFGGNDGFNMLVPRSGDPYLEYEAARGNLALENQDLLAINPLNNTGPELGLHPQLEGVKNLFNAGKLSFLTNVGPKKIQNTTAEHVANQQNVPLSLFSHIDQARQWQTAEVQARSHIGWAGKIADMLHSTCNTNTNISMNISLFNHTFFLTGENENSFAINNRGTFSTQLYNPNSTSGYFHARTGAIDSMHQHDYQNLFYNNFNSIMDNSIDTNFEYQDALDDFENNGGLTTSFTDNITFSKDLKMVAKSIAIAENLGFKRQIYFVNVGGFDNHDDLILDHGNLMGKVDTALVEFYAALEELGKEDSVVTFSMSDFGRTLTSNGSGSDHAWGNNAIVMGGPVVGESLFGNYPALNLASDMVYSNKGILIPEMASDLYFAELALWFGVPMSDLGLVFPNLSEFFDTSLGNQPLGFLTM